MSVDRVSPSLAPTTYSSFSHFVSSAFYAMKELAKTIVKIAIQILFPILLTAMVSSVIPVNFYAVVLPLTAIGGAFLSSFFFSSADFTEAPLYSSITSPSICPLEPSKEPLPPLDPNRPKLIPNEILQRPLPAGFPVDAPRGIYNEGNNCAFNAMIHFLQSDPLIAASIRNLVPQGENLAEYDELLQRYRLSQVAIAAFHHFIEADEAQLPLKDKFSHFLETYQPVQPGDYLKLENIKKAALLAPHFHKFFESYDRAKFEGKMVADYNTQELRLALRTVNAGINRSSSVQEDAHEILLPILDLLPEDQKMVVEQHIKYDTSNLSPIRDKPDGISKVPGGLNPLIQLQVNGFANLAESFQNACSYSIDAEGVEFRGIDGELHRYRPVETDIIFIEAPKSLRFQVKRFNAVISEKTFWDRWLPWFFSPESRIGKITDPFEAPEALGITLEDGSQKIYRLSSFINHSGDSAHSGHYTAGRKMGEQNYLMSDTAVTLADPESWNRAKNQAYLYCYVPVEAAAG